MTVRLAKWFPVLLLMGAWPCVAADPEPLVDIKRTDDGDIWQGQRVVFTVILKTPETFASAPDFDLPRVPGVILVPPQGRPILGTEMIGEDSYTTQTHELAVFPQRPGGVTIPPWTIRFDSSKGFGQPVQARTVTTSPVTFTVKPPPGTEHLAAVLTTTKLSVTESWQPEPGQKPVAAGAAFTRTIRITADNLPGIVLPTFRTQPPEGLRLYDHDPTLNDQDDRGPLVGQRTDTTTIVCERSGHYELPAMSVAWWNPEEQKLHEALLPARTITVTAPPGPQPSDSSTAPVSSKRNSFLLPVIGVIAGLGGICLVWLWWRKRRQAHQLATAESEQHRFRDIVQSCRSGDARTAYQAILKWRDAMMPGAVATDSRALRLFADDAELVTEMNRLESSLYGPPLDGPVTTSGETNWSPPRLLDCLTRFRTRWKRESATSSEAHRLPEMNPSGDSPESS